MAQSSFTRKLLSLSVQLAGDPQTNQPQQFAETGADTVTITDKRISVRIQNSGAPSASAAQVMAYGLSQSVMNQLSTLGMVLNLVPKNTLTIAAGNDPSALSTVFIGTIVEAYADYASAPDVPFVMNCQAGAADLTAPAVPTSYAGKTQVATIMAAFARAQNLGFENNGVTASLTNAYYSGSIVEQRQQCARDANINAEVVNGNVLAIWPRFGSRNTQSVPLIAAPPQGQMIGYPSFTQQGILVRNLFDPQISFGGKVQVQTDEEALQKANGTWTIHKLDLALDSQVPGGEWSMTAFCYNPNSPSPVIPPP